MALYDAPVHSGYKILTHTSSRRFQKNGFAQVGNTTLPVNSISPGRVTPSAIFNKNLSLRGISEAGYGRRFPYYGLSYSGAGSPRTSTQSGLAYSGAGSYPSGLRYSGAGSFPAGLRYSGAGSPRTSVLRDAYIDDNPRPGSLGKIGIPGRRNSIRGLSADPQSGDEQALVDTGETYGPALPAPTSPGFFNQISDAFSTILGKTVATATQVGQGAAANAVANAIAPPPRPNPVQQAVTAVKKVMPTTILGMTAETALLVGSLAAGYYFFVKK